MAKIKKKQINTLAKRLEKTKATIVHYFTQQKIKINKDTVGKFTYNWIRTRGKNKDFKPYRVKIMIVDIITVLDEIMRPITMTIKRAIKIAASKASGKVFKNRLQQPKRATPYTPREMKPIITKLLESNDRRKIQAATVLALVSVSGSRTGDTLGTFWEDALIEKREDRLFLCIPFRVSKNNQIPDTAQQLTAPMGPNSIIDVEKILRNWRKKQGYPNKGPIFPPKTKNETTAMRRIWDNTAKDLSLDMQIGAHSGRNNAVKMCYLAKVPETAMRSWLSWKNNSTMPGHYRGTMMETSDTGAASLLLDMGFNDEKMEPIMGNAAKLVKKNKKIPTVGAQMPKRQKMTKRLADKSNVEEISTKDIMFKKPDIPRKFHDKRGKDYTSTVEKITDITEPSTSKKEPHVRTLYKNTEQIQNRSLAQIREQARQECLAMYKLN